jgi:hypothetical protein
MDTLYSCCAGLDVHKATVVTCVRTSRRQGPPGGADLRHHDG